jgi:hypothetical protein
LTPRLFELILFIEIVKNAPEKWEKSKAGFLTATGFRLGLIHGVAIPAQKFKGVKKNAAQTDNAEENNNSKP